MYEFLFLHHRDHDELRYSVRSALQYFGPHLGRLHVLSGDFDDPRIPATTELDGSSPPPSSNRRGDGSPEADNNELEMDGFDRLGQIPQWLRDDVDVTRRADDEEKISLQFHHHSQFFRDYKRPTFNR